MTYLPSSSSGPGHWKALWYDWKRVHMATEDYDPDDDELLLMDGSGTGGYKAILYNQAEALAVVNTHFPLAGMVIHDLFPPACCSLYIYTSTDGTGRMYV